VHEDDLFQRSALICLAETEGGMGTTLDTLCRIPDRRDCWCCLAPSLVELNLCDGLQHRLRLIAGTTSAFPTCLLLSLTHVYLVSCSPFPTSTLYVIYCIAVCRRPCLRLNLLPILCVLCFCLSVIMIYLWYCVNEWSFL
jgi:hypothetical protein